MQAHNDRDQFAPPQPPARLRAITLAVLTHAVLISALTWGVSWKSSADLPAVEAELWAAVPQQAAPRAVAPPPEAPPPPEIRTPAPAPPPRAQEPPDTRQADIAIEREKKRLEREKRERERKEEERRERQEKEKEQREKQLAEQKKAEQDKLKKLAEDKRKADEAVKRRAEADAREARQLAEQREANLRRIQGLAGASGGETATGTALRNAGPSGSYGGKVAAKVKPNIVYPDALAGNPRAVVEVRAAPDGTITGKRLIQSSGNKAWDDAVLRALDKTESLPRDIDGRVPSSLEIGFRPQD